MGRDSASAPKSYPSSKPHLVKGSTLNQIWDAIRANQVISGVGTVARQTPDGTAVDVDPAILNGGGSGIGTLKAVMFATGNAGGVSLDPDFGPFSVILAPSTDFTLAAQVWRANGTVICRWYLNDVLITEQVPPDYYWGRVIVGSAGVWKMEVTDGVNTVEVSLGVSYEEE